MKKIYKSAPPNLLTEFKDTNPDNNWDHFRNHNNGDSYKSVREQMFIDQKYLCTYCEISIKDTLKQRVEHFHPKSDTSVESINWALEWSNIFGVCLGGQRDGGLHPLPDNLSCDATKGKQICDGYIINPLQIDMFPCLFDFSKSNGELTVNMDSCLEITVRGNKFLTTKELVENTLVILNLNCDRLKKQRLEILYEYNRTIAKARREGNKKIFTQLADRWFQPDWKPFFSTRRILLGKYAEDALHTRYFDG